MRFEGDYQRDGAVCVRNVFKPTEVRWVETAIEKNLAEPSPLSKQADEEGKFVEDFRRWPHLPTLHRFMFESAAARIAGELMRSDTVRLHHDHILVKEGGTNAVTPWHQDEPYYNISGNQNISMWMPVDTVTSASALQFIAGSHKGPLYLPRTFRDGVAKWFPEGALPEMPEFGDAQVIRWALQPGDAVFFNMRVVHGASGVERNRRRRVLSLRFIGDDVRLLKRPWVTSPPFNDVERDLDDGSPMIHDTFPILWKKQ